MAAKLNKTSIYNKVKKWSTSDAGKSRIDKTIKGKIPSNTDLYNSIDAYIDHYVQMFKAILNNKITEANASIESGSNPIERPSYSAPSLSYNGKYTVDITFKRIHSDSWYPEEYDGVDNLIKLLDQGYSARSSVYLINYENGTVKRNRDGTVKVSWSLKKRDGLHFTRKACTEFNGRTPANIKATPYWG